MDKSTRLTNAAYDEFKSFMFIVFPTISSVTFFLSFFAYELVWFMGILSLLSFFLGICLTISTRRYKVNGAAYDGKMIIDTSDEENKKFTLEVDFDLDKIETKEVLTFKIVPSKE